MRDDGMNAFAELEKDVQAAYEVGVTMEDGERLAAKFLRAMMQVSTEIRIRSLDARMKKNGYKTTRAAKYMEIVNASDKKPAEAMLDAMLALDSVVCVAQDVYERADEDNQVLVRLFDILRDGHVYFRQIGASRT